jgi:hypothetical protein
MFSVNRASPACNGIYCADYVLWKINSMIRDITCSLNVRLNHFLKFGEKVQSDSCRYKTVLHTLMNFVGILLIVLLN